MPGYDKSKHKRGQPDNAGQFASNDEAKRSNDVKENINAVIRKYSDSLQMI